MRSQKKAQRTAIVLFFLVLTIFLFSFIIEDIFPLAVLFTIGLFLIMYYLFGKKSAIFLVIFFIIALSFNGIINVGLEKMGYALFTNEGYSNYNLSRGFNMPPRNMTLVKLTKDVYIGDMVVYKYGSIYIVHQIIGRNKDGWIVKGLNNESIDPPVKDSQVIGKVVKFLGIPFYLTSTWILLMYSMFITILFIGSVTHDKTENWNWLPWT